MGARAKDIEKRLDKLEAAVAVHQELASRASSVDDFDWKLYWTLSEELDKANPFGWKDETRLDDLPRSNSRGACCRIFPNSL